MELSDLAKSLILTDLANHNALIYSSFYGTLQDEVHLLHHI